MGFAVFNKNEFVDWWLNSRQDKDWIERTIRAKGWSPQDIEVVDADFPRDARTIFSFDATKRVEILTITRQDFDDGKGGTVSKKVAQVVETHDSEPHFIAGSYAKDLTDEQIDAERQKIKDKADAAAQALADAQADVGPDQGV